MNTSQQYWEHPEERWQHFDEEYGFVVRDTKLDKKWGTNKDFSHPSELSAQLNALEQALAAERERAEELEREAEQHDLLIRDTMREKDRELQAEREKSSQLNHDLNAEIHKRSQWFIEHAEMAGNLAVLETELQTSRENFNHLLARTHQSMYFTCGCQVHMEGIDAEPIFTPCGGHHALPEL